MQPTMNEQELADYLDEVFPETSGRFEIEEVGPMYARLRLKVGPRDLRPGGTISGPSMFTLADCAFYAATLAMIGRQALTVTTNC
ncbi:MAG: PaaI family thioesterase, partial [Pseudomonadota bacterium]